MASETFNFTNNTFLSTKKLAGIKPLTGSERAWTILEASSYPRRIQGFFITPQTDNEIILQFWVSNISPESFKFDSGPPAVDRGYRLFSLKIDSGNQHKPIDVFSNENCSSIFQRQRDAAGVTYFNFPKDWVIGVTHSELDELVYTIYGEVYGA